MTLFRVETFLEKQEERVPQELNAFQHNIKFKKNQFLVIERTSI